jgi:hypothetical protein
VREGERIYVDMEWLLSGFRVVNAEREGYNFTPTKSYAKIDKTPLWQGLLNKSK